MDDRWIRENTKSEPVNSSNRRYANGVPITCYEVTVNEGVEKIPEYTFYRYYELAKITLPTSLKEIGDHAFVSCNSLREVVISEKSSLREIRACAFAGCPIKSIEIPDSVDSIGESAFAKCAELENLKLPAQLQELESRMCYGCEKLNDLILPSQLREIGKKVFTDCHVLDGIAFPENLRYIGDEAFARCWNLKEIRVPGNCEISPTAFDGCGKIHILRNT